ncbi:MAG TPA: hypothetical protein DCQ06_05495 [Myxococcales bacterium]|nr:hypothetical protein [Myxococcales bacterium]
MANPMTEQIARHDDGFERFDAQLYRIETGVMTFALMAMSVTYFLKIIFEAVIAERNFVEAFLLRWLHSGESAPSDILVQRVEQMYAPALVVAVIVGIGLGVARTISHARTPQGRRAPWSTRDLLVGVLVGIGQVGLGWLVVNVPSKVLCGLGYGGLLVLFGWPKKERGIDLRYIATWALLTVPIGTLISRIPDQYAWVNDLSKVLIMYVGFLGASMASRERKHIVLNFGRKLWPQVAKRGVEMFSLSVWMLFNLLLLALSWHLFALQVEAKSTLAILPIPEYHIVLPVVLSFALMSVRVGADLVRLAQGKSTQVVEGSAS